MSSKEEDEREELHHRISVALRILALAQKGLEDAQDCPDFAQAKLKAGEAIRALQSLVHTSRPPGAPPLL
jgi:hypothetical protein